MSLTVSVTRVARKCCLFKLKIIKNFLKNTLTGEDL